MSNKLEFGARVKERWPHIDVQFLEGGTMPGVTFKSAMGDLPVALYSWNLLAANAGHAAGRLQSTIEMLESLMALGSDPKWVLQFYEPKVLDDSQPAPFVVHMTLVVMDERVGVATAQGLESATLTEWANYEGERNTAQRVLKEDAARLEEYFQAQEDAAKAAEPMVSNVTIEVIEDADEEEEPEPEKSTVRILAERGERIFGFNSDRVGGQVNENVLEGGFVDAALGLENASPLTVDFAKALREEFPRAFLKFLTPKELPVIDKVIKRFYPQLFELQGSSLEKLKLHVLEQFTLLWKQLQAETDSEHEYEFHCQFSEVHRINASRDEDEGGVLSVMAAIAIVPRFPCEEDAVGSESDINMEVVEALQGEQKEAAKRTTFSLTVGGPDWHPTPEDLKALTGMFLNAVIERAHASGVAAAIPPREYVEVSKRSIDFW